MERFPQKHSSQQRGEDEGSQFLAYSLELHSLNLHSLFSLLANLQTLQKDGGVERFLKYSLSEVDFCICFSYRTLLMEHSKTVFPNSRPSVLSTDSDLGHS